MQNRPRKTAADRTERVVVQDDLTIHDHPDVQVIGDLANFTSPQDGKPFPGIFSVRDAVGPPRLARLPQSRRGPLPVGPGVRTLKQRRAPNQVQLAGRAASTGVKEIQPFILQGKERGRLAAAPPGYLIIGLTFCQCAEVLDLEAYLHDPATPDGARVDLLVHQPCSGYVGRIDSDG